MYKKGFILTFQGQRQLADVMFRYYDDDADRRLDAGELGAGHRGHVDALTQDCHLLDLIRREDLNNDWSLDASEFDAAFGVLIINNFCYC